MSGCRLKPQSHGKGPQLPTVVTGLTEKDAAVIFSAEINDCCLRKWFSTHKDRKVYLKKQQPKALTHRETTV